MAGYRAGGRAAWVALASGVLVIAACSHGAVTASRPRAGLVSPTDRTESACSTVWVPKVDGHGPRDANAAGRDVARAYTRFFDPGTSLAQREMLLQEGPALGPVLEGLASALVAKASVVVTAIEFTSATTAAVSFNLCASSAPTLRRAAGTAQLQAGAWKITAATLCNLVWLAERGSVAPGCD